MKKCESITSPSEDTHLKTITVCGNLLCIIRGVFFGLYTIHLLFCVFFLSWQKFSLLEKKHIVCCATGCFTLLRNFFHLCLTISRPFHRVQSIVKDKTFISSDKAQIPMPGFLKILWGILLYERNQIVFYGSFFLLQPCSLYCKSLVMFIYLLFLTV